MRVSAVRVLCERESESECCESECLDSVRVSVSDVGVL